MDAKAFYKSKIFWLAITTVVISVADQLQLLTNLLPVEYQGVYTAVLGVAILIARLLSGQSISIKDVKKDAE